MCMSQKYHFWILMTIFIDHFYHVLVLSFLMALVYNINHEPGWWHVSICTCSLYCHLIHHLRAFTLISVSLIADWYIACMWWPYEEPSVHPRTCWYYWSLSLSLSCVSICLFLFVFMYMQLLSANLCKPSHAYKYKLRTIVRNYSAHSIWKLSMLYFFFRNQNTHLGLVQKRREKGGEMVKCREILQTHFWLKINKSKLHTRFHKSLDVTMQTKHTCWVFLVNVFE